MKIHKSEIVPKLKQLRAFLPVKNNIPAAQGILYRDNMLIANNLEIAVATPIETNSSESFIITPSAIDFIMNVSNDELTIEQKNGKLCIKCGKSRASFGALSPEDFPTSELYSLEGVSADYECSAEKIMREISRVLFACDVGKNTTRPIYEAVKFHMKKGVLNMAASDGQRVAWNTVPCAVDIDVSIHKQHLQKIISLGLSGPLKLFMLENRKIAFQTSEYSVFSSTISGDYMDYQSIYSKAEKICKKSEIETEPLIETLKRAIICGGSAQPVEFVFSAEKLTVNLLSATAEFSEEIPIKSELTDIEAIGFNPTLLLEALKAAESKTVKIGVSGAMHPFIINSGELRQVIMPVRLKQRQG